MKIVYCIYDHTAKGGTERIISRKCNYLADVANMDIYIVDCCQSKQKSFYPYSQKITFFDLHINYLKFRKLNLLFKIITYPFLYFLHERRLSSLINRIDPDIVISTFSYEASILPRIKHRSAKILEFHHCRGYKTLELANRNLSWIQKRLLSRKEENESKIIVKYDRFVVQTEEDKGSWGNPPNCKVIPNMNSFSTDQRASLKKKKILGLGRLTYQKGFDLLLKAWNKIANLYPDWKLDIVGDGEEKEYLDKLIKEYSLTKQASLLPYTSNVIDLYLDHSLYVLSSRHEGFGLTLTEAMECGLPCIAFNCKSGPSEIINDGVDGFLVENGNTQALADKIAFLIINTERRKEMGKFAKENVTRFSESSIMAQWIKLFEQIIS